jgi:hypothetical protein
MSYIIIIIIIIFCGCASMTRYCAVTDCVRLQGAAELHIEQLVGCTAHLLLLE